MIQQERWNNVNQRKSPFFFRGISQSRSEGNLTWKPKNPQRIAVLQVEPPNGRPVTQFFITTPDPAPNLKRLSDLPSDWQKEKEIKSTPLLPTVHVKYPTFQDKKLNFTNYGITLKTVLRQSKIDYLLEYFKGDDHLGIDCLK